MYDLRLLFTDGIYEFDTYEFGRDVPFKIFKSDDTAFDLTGYTVVIRLLDDSFAQDINDITPTIATPSSGAGIFEFTSSNRPTVEGYYYVEAKLTKSGEQRYAISPRVYVHPSPD